MFSLRLEQEMNFFIYSWCVQIFTFRRTGEVNLSDALETGPTENFPLDPHQSEKGTQVSGTRTQ